MCRLSLKDFEGLEYNRVLLEFKILKLICDTQKMFVLASESDNLSCGINELYSLLHQIKFLVTPSHLWLYI